MRKLFTFSLLTGLLLCSCQINEPELTNEQEPTFTATVENGFDDGATRTFLDSKGNVHWKKGDQVSIFAGSTINEQYQVTDDSEGKTTAGLNKIPSSQFVAGGTISNNVAFYPYTSTAEILKEEDGISYVLTGIELPATQIYAEDSFGNGAFPMAAVTSSASDMNLKFKNVLSGMQLQLKGSARIASISISGNANEKLCGSANVTVSTSDTPTIEMTDKNATTVTLNCGTEGVQLNTETATSFIIALPPVAMTSGFKVTVTDTDGKKMEINTSKSLELHRSMLLRISPVEYVGKGSGSESGETDYLKEPFTITSVGNTTVALVKEGSPADITLEYRTSTTDWAPYTIDTAISLTDGSYLQFRAGEGGNDTFSEGDEYDSNSKTIAYNYYKIQASGTGKLKASGNAMSLYDKTLSETSMTMYGFYRLFYECDILIDASNLKLSATTLAEYCYEGMFIRCIGLSSAPELPAGKLAAFCYSGMFSGCTSLTIAPSLPTKSLAHACYSHMFSGCTSLTSAPVLPAKILTTSCYQGMFSDCTSLTIAPDLPATTLAQQCYHGMFEGCEKLITVPSELPAMEMANFSCSEMFSGCTSLTTAPNLPATTLASHCYSDMFHGCTSLTSAPKLPATSLKNDCYEGMFQGCIGLTTAPALPAKDLAEDCYHFMFLGCTGLTSAPELPATKLANRCYGLMFHSCTSLKTAPELPATDLVDKCYDCIFLNCKNLNFIKALFTTEPSDTSTKNWVSGVASKGTFVKSKDAKWDVTGVNGIPKDWTVSTE
jgi:hypothetical protein